MTVANFYQRVTASQPSFGDRRLPKPSLLESKHILHGVKSGRFTDDPLCGAQRTLGENFPAACAMRELEAFAWLDEVHGVFADNFALPNRFGGNLFVDLAAGRVRPT